MGMSDCEKCWDTPCGCGWDYRNWSDSRFSEFISDITIGRIKYRAKKTRKESKKTRDIPFPDGDQ